MKETKYFNGSRMMKNQEEIDWLISNLPRRPKEITILYDPLKHGWSPTDFHEICDDHPRPTITVIKSKANKIFGGYTNDKWSS